MDLFFQASDSLFGIPARGFFCRKVRRYGFRRLDLGFKCPGFLNQACKLLFGADAGRFFLCHARRRLIREDLLLLGRILGGADGGFPLGTLRGYPLRQFGGADGRLHFRLLLEPFPGGFRFQRPGFFLDLGNLFLGGDPGGFLLSKPLGCLADLLLFPLRHAAGNSEGFLLLRFFGSMLRIAFRGASGRLGIGVIPNPLQDGFFLSRQGQDVGLGLLLASQDFRHASFRLCSCGVPQRLLFGCFFREGLFVCLLLVRPLPGDFRQPGFLGSPLILDGQKLRFDLGL